MSHNTLLHRSIRAGVRPLAKTPITPNYITTARLLTGLLAAGLFAIGDPVLRYWAAAVFLLSMLFDRADGELARLSGKSSPWGHKYDLVCDALCNALAFVGIGIGLREGIFGWIAIPMGLIAGASVAIILWMTTRIEKRHGQRAAEIKMATAFDPDDAILILPLAAFLNWLEPTMAAASIGAPLFAIWAYHYCWRELLTERADTG